MSKNGGIKIKNMKTINITVPFKDIDDLKNVQLNFNFQKETGPEARWESLSPLSLNDVGLVTVPWPKYYKDVFDKAQIVLHHTVSGPGIIGDLAHWKKFGSHIATCIIIERDGKINQLFDSKYWGYHLNCGNEDLDKCSIAIELDNWGQLEKKNGGYYTSYNNRVDVPVIEYPGLFRGERYFEGYTEKQIFSLGRLLLFLCEKYSIPKTYNKDMWEISKDALEGKPGIWGHISFRSSGKWDPHPDPLLVSLLENLSKF